MLLLSFSLLFCVYCDDSWQESHKQIILSARRLWESSGQSVAGSTEGGRREEAGRSSQSAGPASISRQERLADLLTRGRSLLIRTAQEHARARTHTCAGNLAGNAHLSWWSLQSFRRSESRQQTLPSPFVAVHLFPSFLLFLFQSIYMFYFFDLPPLGRQFSPPLSVHPLTSPLLLHLLLLLPSRMS